MRGWRGWRSARRGQAGRPAARPAVRPAARATGRRRGARRAALGRYGEDLAAQHLTATGAVILARNWRCRAGELDIVALEPDGPVVFCEVKARSGTAFGSPAEAVTARKVGRIRGLACRWLDDHRPPGARGLRFDVVAVLRAPGCAPQVTHLKDVF